jgi:hypothetical protein
VVTNRVKTAISPTLQAISRTTDDSAAVDELFLTFLSREPSSKERQAAVGHLAKARNAAERNTFLEDLAWVCINKVEFLFSY